MKKHVGVLDVFCAVALSTALMYAFWQTFDPRVIVMAIATAGLTETVIQMRWRLGLTCKRCGFDPVLYLKDSERAALQVKAFLERQKLASGGLLVPKLPPRPMEPPKPRVPATMTGKKGKIMERQV